MYHLEWRYVLLHFNMNISGINMHIWFLYQVGGRSKTDRYQEYITNVVK